MVASKEDIVDFVNAICKDRCDAETVSDLVTNGTMEADANWTTIDGGGLVTNERSNTYAHAGTYSRRLLDSVAVGIKSDPVSVTARLYYRCIAWVYITDEGAKDYGQVTMALGDGDGNSEYTEVFTLPFDTWYQIGMRKRCDTTGVSSYVSFALSDALGHNYYFDDVSVKEDITVPSLMYHDDVMRDLAQLNYPPLVNFGDQTSAAQVLQTLTPETAVQLIGLINADGEQILPTTITELNSYDLDWRAG